MSNYSDMIILNSLWEEMRQDTHECQDYGAGWWQTVRDIPDMFDDWLKSRGIID